MKKNYYIIFLGTSFLLLLSAIGGYVYLYSRITKKTESVESVAIEIENEKRSQQNISGLKRSIVLTEQKNKILESHFVTEGKVVNFIESIEMLGKESGVVVDIQSLQPGEQTGKEGLYVTLSLSGEFNSVNKFILLLENMPYQIVLGNVILSTDKKPVPSSSSTDPSKAVPTPVGNPKWKASVDFVLTSYKKE